jgi:predicted Zn-dependent protease
MRDILPKAIVVVLCFIAFSACADKKFQSLGSSLLRQTGLVSGAQANSIMRFGGSVAESTKEISDEEEYYLGRGVSATILSRYRPYRNPTLNRYVNKIAAVLAAVSDRPETFGGYYVQILDSQELNAISAPGGFIFITTGFLKTVPNEDALAAVLAHEVAHVVKGHGMSAISEASLSKALLRLGQDTARQQGGVIVGKVVNTFGDSVSDIASTLLSNGYSRSQEYDADSYAAILLERAGYDVKGLGLMLERIDADESSGGWHSTHPSARDRIAELGSSVGEKYVPNPIRSRRFAQAFKSLS